MAWVTFSGVVRVAAMSLWSQQPRNGGTNLRYALESHTLHERMSV